MAIIGILIALPLRFIYLLPQILMTGEATEKIVTSKKSVNAPFKKEILILKCKL